MNMINTMLETILQPGLAMFERLDYLANISGSHSIGYNNIEGDDIIERGWVECNFITQTLLEDHLFYRDYAYSLWDAAALQLANHTGCMADLSRTTIALLKAADYDGSGRGPFIGGLNPQNLSDINLFNSQDVEFAQVKQYLVEFAERYASHHLDEEMNDTAFRWARFMDNFREASIRNHIRGGMHTTWERADYHAEMHNAFTRARYSEAMHAFRRV